MAETIKHEPVQATFGAQLRDFSGEDIDQTTIDVLERMSEGDLQQALNIWFDGSWRENIVATPSTGSLAREEMKHVLAPIERVEKTRTWKKLYLGAFGCQGYLTRSTTLVAGQKLSITRQSLNQPTAKPKARSKTPRPAYMEGPKAKINYITRFCVDGAEVGRLPQDEAMVMSTLLDLDMCHFEGVVIYASERARTGSNVDLQISCYIKRSAFQTKSTPSSGIVMQETQETSEERMLKMRRFSLLKLLDLIGLAPVGSSALKEAEITQDAPTNKADKSSSDEEAEDGAELQADQLDSLYSKAQTFDHNMAMMEPADTFEFTLKPYQKQALNWMVNKEQPSSQEARKTESMHPLWQRIDFPPSEETRDESVFYMNPYSGELSLNFPKAMDESRGGILADEMGLGKTIEILALVHTARMKREAEDASLKSMMNRQVNVCHTTLVVAPLSLLQQWQSEAENASKEGTLKTLLYYGNEKALDLYELCHGANARLAPDVLITSYGTLLSEWTKQQESGAAPTGLFGIDFYRVVLDEAHTIKNRQAKTSKACYAIRAGRRWALTGTPIVNKLEDLFSLVHYLSVEPWGHFAFWRTFITIPFESKDYIRALDVVQTVLEPLVLRRTKDMRDVDGKPIVDLPSKTIEKVYLEFGENERDIYNFISARARRTYNQNAQAGTVMKNYTYILSMILRLRQACCDPVLVKHKAEKSELVDEGADESAEVDDLQEDVDLQELIAKYASRDAEEERSATSFGTAVLQEIKDGAEQECPICTEEPIQDPTVTACFHMACKKCLLEHIEFQKAKGEDPLCHTCRAPVSEKDLLEVIRHANEEGEQIFLRPAQHSLGSTKIDKLLKSLHETRRIDPRIKSVVFSQFTSFLDIIQKSLKRQKLPFCRLDGSMAMKDRAAVLERFRTTPGNMTLIISLKAGGVGLNLTSANHVYMLDPWWSFAIESQAIDRIHRMGQTREVKVFRYIIQNSVEEKMLKIQDRKNFLASSLGMSKEEKRRETLKDIEMLFED